MDDDLQRQLRNLADEASPRPGSEDVVVKRAKTKRRLVGGFATLVLVALIGGLAGATTFLGDRGGIKPAPGPEETAGCVSAGYDLAVFVPEKDFHAKMMELEDRLGRHDAVASFEFVSAADAMQEYLRENPDHAGPAPTQARRSQYRVTVETGVDPHRLSSELARLGGGGFVPALDCPPREPQEKFARYVFEIEEGDASAAGTLEVDWPSRTLCLEVQTRDIKASHLLFMDPDAPDGRVVLTFFDPHDGEEGANLRPTGAHCFAGEQLNELDEDLLVRLLDHPGEFRVDFHRGPDDEPSLIAELVPQGADEPCAMGAAITEITAATVAPGERVMFAGECFQDLRLHKKTRVFLTATVDEEGRPIAKADLGARQPCELIAQSESKVRIFENGELRGWLIVPSDGTCYQEDSARTHVPLRPGTYRVAIGCRVCAYANLRVDPGATSSASEPTGARALVRVFMQRRVAGAGAEQFLDRHGRADFGPGEDLAPLYPDPPLEEFQIEFVDDVGNGSYEVGVSLIFQKGTYEETLFVRERNGDLVISGGRPGLEGP